MKKFLLLIFSIGLISTAQAQFGIRAGLNSTTFSDTNFDSRLGFHVGGYYKLKAGLVAIEPGIQFSQKGYKGTDGQSGDDVNERLNYIDIPVLVRVNIIPAVNIFAGPQGSLLISRNYELGNSSSTSTEVVKGYDIGAVLGVGVNLPLGFNVQGSYDLGISDLNYFNTDVKNRGFKLSIGKDF